MNGATTGSGPDVATLVALGSAGLVMLVALWGVARARGQRALSGFSLLLGAAAAALTLVLPALTFGAVLKPPVMASLLVAGAVVGLVLGLRPRLRLAGGGVTVSGGAWFGVPLALSIACLQVAGVVQSADGVILAVGGLHVAAALVVASAFVLVARRLAMGRAGPAPSPVLAAIAPAAVAPALVAPALVAPPPASPARAAPGTQVPAPAAPVPGQRTAGVVMTCAACGSPVSVGWRHCVACGATLAWG